MRDACDGIIDFPVGYEITLGDAERKLAAFNLSARQMSPNTERYPLCAMMRCQIGRHWDTGEINPETGEPEIGFHLVSFGRTWRSAMSMLRTKLT